MSEREKLKPEEKVKNRNKIHSGRGKHKQSGSRGRCGSENTSKVGHAVRGRGRSGLPAGQAGAYIQSGIKAAGGTGVKSSVVICFVHSEHLLQNRNSRLISFENQAAMYAIFSSANRNLFVQCSRYNCYYVLIRVQTHIRGTSSVLQYQHM